MTFFVNQGKSRQSRDDRESVFHASRSTYRFLSGIADENLEEDQQAAVREFVRRNLKQRTCCAFIGEKDSNGTLCQCGRQRDLHTERALQNEISRIKWSPDRHSVDEECSSFGEINFSGFGTPGTHSPYARIDYETDADTIWSLLTDVWGLSPPRLVVSVTGGAKAFYLKARLREALKQGLISITHSTGAWIITGGTATGVMKYVGESVRDYGFNELNNPHRRMVAIGVVSWGIVDNSQSLVGQEDMGLFPAMYNLRECVNSRKAPLDHNHTHFLLVDDGTEGKYGVEIPIRSSLEEIISQQTHQPFTSNSPVSTPVVLVIVEGGPNSLETARSAMSHGVPVVVLKESGRAADVLAEAYQITKIKKGEEESSFFPDSFKKDMTKIIAEKFELDPDSGREVEIIEKAIRSLEEMLQNRSLITLFSLEDVHTKELDKAILYALLKSKSSDLATQVELALIWNRSDIAKELIFIPENRTQLKELHLDHALYSALLQNEVEFVQLFLENGLELKNFLTHGRLRNLYTISFQDDQVPINALIRNIFTEITQATTCCNWMLYKRSSHLVSDDQALLFHIGLMIELLLNEQLDNIYEDTLHDTTKDQKQSNHLFENPERDLFLWAIIFAKFDIAIFLWGCIPNPVGGALISSLILKTIHKLARGHEEVTLSEQLEEESKKYEQLACGVLGKCYEMNKSASLTLLTRDLIRWGHCSAFVLAGNNGQRMDFMSLSASQAKLSRIWLSHMSEYTGDWRVFLTTICPLFIFPLIRFKASEFEKAEEPRRRSITTTKDNKEKKDKDEAIKSGIEREAAHDATMMERIASHLHGHSEAQGKLYKVSLLSGRNRIGIFSALYYFYTAPAAKFTTHAISHLIFLAIFTCVVLTELRPVGTFGETISILESIIWFWAGTLLLDEIRQLLCSESRSFRVKVYVYFCSFWNSLDFVLCILLVATIALRLSSSKHDQTIPRITYAILLMFWYLRFMSYFFLWRSIGPKIFMIRQMIRDLMFFICILLIFILSFGIPMQALLHPSRKFSWEVIVDAVYAPYFNIFGELMLDRFQGRTYDGQDCTDNETISQLDSTLELCPKKTWLVPFLFAIYIMLTNVLLLNLLIAMFSYTFQQVQDNSEKVWRYYRYQLVDEAHEKPAIPPPLIILAQIFQLFQYFWRKVFGGTPECTHGFKVTLEPELDLKLNHLERIGRDKYLAILRREELETTETQLSEALARLDALSEKVDNLHDQLKAQSYRKER